MGKNEKKLRQFLHTHGLIEKIDSDYNLKTILNLLNKYTQHSVVVDNCGCVYMLNTDRTNPIWHRVSVEFSGIPLSIEKPISERGEADYAQVFEVIKHM